MYILKYSNIAMVHLGRFCSVEKNRIPLPESPQIAQVNPIAHPSNVFCAPHPSNVLVCQMAGVRRGSLGLSSGGTEGKGSKLEQGARSKEAPRLLVKHIISSHSRDGVVREASKSKVHPPPPPPLTRSPVTTSTEANWVFARFLTLLSFARSPM